MKTNNKPNKLINETSPYLLQHAYNPVNWYSWGESAFEKAKSENKPIFLSIGYSTCHWCHVMEQESFEDEEVAKLLNDNFIAIKVDKEERPDIDATYMKVCQALTQSGGWPLTIIMSANQMPFFAGTYLPKQPRYHSIGLIQLLTKVHEQWTTNQDALIASGNAIVDAIKKEPVLENIDNADYLIEQAVATFKEVFDHQYGGIGSAPKFPMPHFLLFLLEYYKHTKDEECLNIVETSATCMYQGGIFDHIGYGFSRYSTDEKWLVPHFEKMLYDNALLTYAYMDLYEITNNELYKDIAKKTITYVQRELTNSKGAFFCAQDADSDGVEGKFYVFTPNEIITLLGKEDGMAFNEYFDISEHGNFDGSSIPNLLISKHENKEITKLLLKVYEYRRDRTSLHLDDKILTSWNALMISALIKASRVIKSNEYLIAAKKAILFIEENLSVEATLYVSYRDGKKSTKAFLDDYAFYIYALIQMYQATFEEEYLQKALQYFKQTITLFFDHDNGGFYLNSKDTAELIFKSKEVYDNAIPSGNSFMYENLWLLSLITKDIEIDKLKEKQGNYLKSNALQYPTAQSFFLYALLKDYYPTTEIVYVIKDNNNYKLPVFPSDAIVVIKQASKHYPLLNDQPTYYVCKGTHCLAPSNELK